MNQYQPQSIGQTNGQPPPLQQAEQLIQQAQAVQAQSHLTRMGVSNISQQIIKAEQQLQKVMQDLQLTGNQLQSQMDAQQRQIAKIQQDIGQAIEQFRVVDSMVKERVASIQV